MYTERIIQVHCSRIKNIRSLKPFKDLFVSMFSILKWNGEKRKVTLSLFNKFLISYTTDLTNSLFICIFNFINVIFLRPFSTQFKKSEFSLCNHYFW